MSYHDKLLDRKDRPKPKSAPRHIQHQIAEELRRTGMFDIPLPPPTASTSGPLVDPITAPNGPSIPTKPHFIGSPSQQPFTVRSLADRWNCSEGAVRSLIRNGKLAHFRVGDLIRVPAEEVGRFECRR